MSICRAALPSFYKFFGCVRHGLLTASPYPPLGAGDRGKEVSCRLSRHRFEAEILEISGCFFAETKINLSPFEEDRYFVEALTANLVINSEENLGLHPCRYPGRYGRR